MKKILLSSLAVILMTAMISCNLRTQDPVEKIETLEQELFSEDAVFDEEGRKKARELVQLYIAYADAHPKDPESPGYIFKAADISMNLLDAGKAINLYNKIVYHYPDFEKAPESLFLVAYIYENYLESYGKAEEIYELFIAKYPEHEFADDAEMSIKNMGKSPEELIREFEERNDETQ